MNIKFKTVQGSIGELQIEELIEIDGIRYTDSGDLRDRVVAVEAQIEQLQVLLAPALFTAEETEGGS